MTTPRCKCALDDLHEGFAEDIDKIERSSQG